MNNKFLLFVLFLVSSNCLCAKTNPPAPNLLLNLNYKTTSLLPKVMVMHKFENLAILTSGNSSSDFTNHASPISTSPIWCTINNNALLPVKLILLNVQKVSNTILISWTTTQEINSNYFTIQHSIDGNNWTSIGNKSAAGTSNSNINYQFTDNAPVTGNNYYRLLQVDKNGATVPSTIINIVIGQNRDPFILTLFNLKKNSNKVLVSWNTMNEFNSISNFIIQHSSNRGIWINIANVIATGTNSKSSNYQVTDNTVVTGYNSYRIMIVYKNDPPTFSTINTIVIGENRNKIVTHIPASEIAIILAPAGNLTITPNPANNFTTISFPGSDHALNKLFLFNTNGVLIKEILTREQYYKLNTSSFSKGIYYIKVLNGNNLTTQKLLIL